MTPARRRPRPAARPGRIAAAEATLAALAADYPALAAETLEELREAWSACQADPPPEAAPSRLFRAAHALKGEGASFGYPLVSAVATSLCLVLEAGHARARPAWPCLEAHVAALEAILAARLAGGGGEVGQGLLLGLRDKVAEAAAAIRAARPQGGPPPSG